MFKLIHRLYKLVISPHFGACCRFYPSCSDYALTAVQERGLICGIFLATRRLLKCQPFYQQKPGDSDLIDLITVSKLGGTSKENFNKE